MIAENKQEFFEQLGRELEKLGVTDTVELMTDLEEHFAEGERRGVPESETCRELGSIAEIARSCLDLKSTAINSMVARDVERKKGVSLTKPGRDVPADPSLGTHSEAENAEELPSYTPEHNSEEIYPNSVPQESTSSAETGAKGEKITGSAETGTKGEESTSSANSEKKGAAGTFEKVGKAVDAALGKAGVAVNEALNKAGTAFRPTDSYREHINSNKNGGELPPQYTKAASKGGAKFVDVSGRTPNPDSGRLVVEILLDVFLWIWLIPTVFALVIAVFGLSIGLIVGGVMCLFGKDAFGQFKLITRVLFGLGFFNLSAALICLATVLIKAPIALAKNVIERHYKAIYNI